MENIESFKETSNPRYLINKEGKVWSTYSNKILACPVNKLGYRRWKSYFEDGSVKIQHVHIEVLYAFSGPRPDGLVVRHLDGDSVNNNLSNLKYGTPLENSADMVMHGNAKRGALLDSEVLEMRYEFSQSTSVEKLMNKYSLNYQTILNYITGRSYSHLPGATPILDFDRGAVIDYIKQGYGMVEISRVTGMSHAAISYLFRRKMSMTIREYRKTHKVKFGAKIPRDNFENKKLK